MLVGIMMHGLVDAAMHASIALLVAGQPLDTDCQRSDYRQLGDGAVAARTGIGDGLADEQVFDSGQLHARLLG